MKDLHTLQPEAATQTFFQFPLCTDVSTLDAHVAILGCPYGDPYGMREVSCDQSNAPLAVRQASMQNVYGLEHWDFDLGGTVFDGKAIKVVDCGDIPADRDNLKEHYRRAELVAREIIARGALPVVIGGDHGVPIPIFRALDSLGPITLVHIDAHLDWRDEVKGYREGYSSPIRRAAEMEHIEQIFQIGLRGVGSARTQEVEDAIVYGCKLFTAYDVFDKGIQSVLDAIPDGGTYYLTIDADGVDPSVMPAVITPAPGGLLYHHVLAVIHGLARKGKLVGMDVVEITPSRDVNSITCLTAARLILNYIGACVRAGYFD